MGGTRAALSTGSRAAIERLFRRRAAAGSVSIIARYLASLAAVTAATGIALVLNRYGIEHLEFPVYLLAVSLAVWYLGAGPGIAAVVLSSLSFDYFFVQPLYTLTVNTADIPYFISFSLFASLVAAFSAIRRRFERQLVASRDELRREATIRAEQASLLDLTHDTIFVRDMADVITFWNRGAEENLGYTASQALGQVAPLLLRSEYPKPIEDIRAELLKTGRWEGELQKTKADGSRVVVASRWSLRRDSTGKPAAILETNNDISDRRRREDEIRKLNADLADRSAALEASNKELEAFAYSISHDLRAPLRHMVGYTELLQKHAGATLDQKSTRFMGVILESAQRMGNLIDDLLAFSRIGRAEARESSVDLLRLVKEVRDEVQTDAPGRKIEWKIGALPELYGDRSMLRVALVNLMSNAVKFTRKRPQAEIEIGCLERQNGVNTLFVKDNGVGFDMKYVGKLFGVFQRLHQTEAFEGTGIGLATVQRIIHRHGGSIWAEGFVDRGATFFFSVPDRKG